MNIAVTTIIAAGIAVLGTLLSPILVQYASARTKAQEYELMRRQRQEEREGKRQLRDFIELRSTYTELNTEMRGFQRALSNYLHLIRSGHCSKDARDALDNVRDKYLQRYADAQMIISDKVLGTAMYAHGGLTRLYGMALRLDGFTVPDFSSGTMADENQEETIEAAFAYLEEVRSRVLKLRDIMRTELGISSAEE